MGEKNYCLDLAKIAPTFYCIRYVVILKDRVFISKEKRKNRVLISNKREYHEIFKRQPRAQLLFLYENDAF